jgi:hypothetical protein
MLKRVFDVLDGIEAVIYVCGGAILLVGSGVWIFMKLAEINPILAIAGASGLAMVVGGAVIHDLMRRRLSRLTKFVLAA